MSRLSQVFLQGTFLHNTTDLHQLSPKSLLLLGFKIPTCKKVMPQPQITWNAAGAHIECMILDSSLFLLMSADIHACVHACVHTVYIYGVRILDIFVYWSRQTYTRPLAATEWREPTPRINNHVSGLYFPSIRSLEQPLRLFWEQMPSADICQNLKYDLLFCPLCRGQHPSQSRDLRVSAGLNQAHSSFRPFPAKGLSASAWSPSA